MSETVTHPTPLVETDVEAEPRISAFKTAKGSVYTYDSEGKTTRFKTATGEQQERQDLTVFVDLTSEEERQFLDAIHTEGDSTKVYVVERQPDDSALIVRDISQVKDPARLYLTVVIGGQIVNNRPVSITPREGADVFDTRHFEENGQMMTERHLGNKVVEISYT